MAQTKITSEQIKHKAHDLAMLKLSKLISGANDDRTILELYETYYERYLKEYQNLTKE